MGMGYRGVVRLRMCDFGYWGEGEGAGGYLGVVTAGKGTTLWLVASRGR